MENPLEQRLEQMLALTSTKRLLEVLEERARAQPGGWTKDQAGRLLALAIHLNPNMTHGELEELGARWWDNLTAEERAAWLQRANSVLPADAWKERIRELQQVRDIEREVHEPLWWLGR